MRLSNLKDGVTELSKILRKLGALGRWQGAEQDIWIILGEELDIESRQGAEHDNESRQGTEHDIESRQGAEHYIGRRQGVKHDCAAVAFFVLHDNVA